MKSYKTILFSCALVASHAFATPITFKLRLPEAKVQEIEEAVLLGQHHGVLKKLLETYILDAKFKDETLEAITDYLQIIPLDDFKGLPKIEQQRLLHEVITEYTKVPGKIIEKMRKREKGIDLVTNAITSHPAYAYLSGVVPRGHARSWDHVVGASASSEYNAVIAADKMEPRYHGSVNVVLHEVAHGIDRYLKDKSDDYDFSQSYKFRPIQDTTPFRDLYRGGIEYYQDFFEENFAEIFALYFHSPETRQRLQNKHPEAYEFMLRSF